MKVLGIIPARGGSKGIPKKNIKHLNGKPLIYYTIKAALESKLDHVIVSTDCSDIADISKKFGVDVMIRPDELSQDTTPTLPVLNDVITKLPEDYDAVMTLQPTSPLRTVKHIDEALDSFKKDCSADSLVSVVELAHNCMPEKLMTFDGTYLQGNMNIRRRQELSTLYSRNGAAIYITKTKNLEKYILGDNILPYFMRKIESFDIDDIEDWEIVEKIISCN